MNKKIIPDWLQQILDDSGSEQGKYSFGQPSLDVPADFVAIAEAEEGGLAVSKKGDGVIYKFQNGEMDIFAMDEPEFKLAIRRDEAWEELSENMPATSNFWLGIVIKTITDSGEELTLGFKGSSRDSVMVIQGEMRAEEMLTDALNRELGETLGGNNFEVMDVYDDGGVMETGKEKQPLFTVVVQVSELDVSTMGDSRIEWINLNKPKASN